MTATIGVRTNRPALGLAALLAAWTASGCASIHSSSVKRLIEIQGRALDEGVTQAEEWSRKAVPEQLETMQKSVERLDQAMIRLQAVEAQHGLVFGSYQNVSTKTGTDAAALGYLAGRIYLADQGGLSLAVKKQLSESEEALQALSARIVESWKRLRGLQRKLDEYAKKSSLAAVDDALVTAVVEQAPGADERVTALLQRTQRVAALLDEASDLGAGATPGAVRSAVGDLVELLERVKKK